MQDQNTAMIRRFVEEVVNGGNLEDIDRVVSDDFSGHLSLKDVPGPAALSQLVSLGRAVFPDLKVTINDQTSEGDTVVTRVTLEGTHQGVFSGIPATGKRVSVTAIATTHHQDRKVVEAWGNLNELLMMQQMGVIPIF